MTGCKRLLNKINFRMLMFMKRAKGKFIVVYGANNVGKTTQTNLLVSKLVEQGYKVKSIKYPIYNLKPTGPQINSVIRGGEKMDELDLQKLFAQNRRDFEPKLIDLLNHGYWIIAEDYKGTGISWGVASGISFRKLEKINNGLLAEDLAIVLDGPRFTTFIERSHRNEDRDKRWELGRKAHLMSAKRYGWKVIQSDRPIVDVGNDIWNAIESTSGLDGYQERPGREGLKNIKLYFSGTIRGAVDPNPELNWKLVQYLKKEGVDVLSEHVVARSQEQMDTLFKRRTGVERGKTRNFPGRVREVDMNWVMEATHLIAMVNGPSFGVGMEIERALLKPRLGMKETPVLCLIHESLFDGLSNMIRGVSGEESPVFYLKTYSDLKSAKDIAMRFLTNRL